MTTRAHRLRRQLTTWRDDTLPVPGARGEDRMLAVIVEAPYRRPATRREPGARWPAPPKPTRTPLR